MIARLIVILYVSLTLTAGLPLLVVGQLQHPVQRPPVSQQLSQLPAGPSQQNTAINEVTTADISAGIKRHIATERKSSADRKFRVNYRGKNLALDLIKVHDDRLSNLGGGKYFACVDMKAGDGTVYDIDFFMSGQPGSMMVTETSVHKINGKPLYNWKEQGGVWKKVRT